MPGTCDDVTSERETEKERERQTESERQQQRETDRDKEEEKKIDHNNYKAQSINQIFHYAN